MTEGYDMALALRCQEIAQVCDELVRLAGTFEEMVEKGEVLTLHAFDYGSQAASPIAAVVAGAMVRLRENNAANVALATNAAGELREYIRRLMS